MRPSAWVTLLVFVIIAAGVRAHSVRASGKAATQQRSTPASAASSSWLVEGEFVNGEWETSQNEAFNAALEQAEKQVTAQLRNRDPRLEWTPSADHIRDRLWKNVPEKLDDKLKALRRVRYKDRDILVEEREFDWAPQGHKPLGKMVRVRLQVELTPEEFGEIKRLDTEYRQQQRQFLSHQRQIILARILAVIVALLGTIVGYFRLEEATKGYYTSLLRVAAVGIIAAVVAGLLLVA